MLDGPDGVAVIGIVVVDELEAGGPVRKEVAIGRQFACDRDGKDVKDGDGKRQAGDSGNRNFSDVAAVMCWRKIQLADHGSYSMAAAEVGDECGFTRGFPEFVKMWRRERKGAKGRRICGYWGGVWRELKEVSGREM